MADINKCQPSNPTIYLIFHQIFASVTVSDIQLHCVILKSNPQLAVDPYIFETHAV